MADTVFIPPMVTEGADSDNFFGAVLYRLMGDSDEFSDASDVHLAKGGKMFLDLSVLFWPNV